MLLINNYFKHNLKGNNTDDQDKKLEQIRKDVENISFFVYKETKVGYTDIYIELNLYQINIFYFNWLRSI